MSNRIKQYLDVMSDIKITIDEFPLEITEGTKKMIQQYNINATKKRNEVVRELIDAYKSDLEVVKKLISSKKEALIPDSQLPDIELNKNRVNLLRKVLKYNNSYNDVYDKTNFAEIIYNIDDIETSDLKEANTILLYIVNKFAKANVKLTGNDFDYSPDTKKYMTMFLEKMDKNDFDDAMTELFESMYWTCPNLLTHLKLNIRHLTLIKEKNLNEFCEMQRKNLFEQSLTDEYNFESSYYNCKKMLDFNLARDCSLNLDKFMSGELNIDKYLVSSIERNTIFNKFTGNVDFNSFTLPQKDKFYLEITNLGDSIVELKNYNLFDFVIKDVISRYKDKDKNKGSYVFKLKQIKKLESERSKKVKKYYMFCKLAKGTDKYLEKRKTLCSLINTDIDTLNGLYNELEDARINEKIALHINDNSSLYDAFELAGSFYGYLKSLFIQYLEITNIKEVNDMIKQYDDFIYDPSIVVLKKLNLLNNDNLEMLIIQKCRLFGISVDNAIVENMDSILEDIEFIKTVRNIETSNLPLDDIKFILDVNSIRG